MVDRYQKNKTKKKQLETTLWSQLSDILEKNKTKNKTRCCTDGNYHGDATSQANIWLVLVRVKNNNSHLSSQESVMPQKEPVWQLKGCAPSYHQTA